MKGPTKKSSQIHTVDQAIRHFAPHTPLQLPYTTTLCASLRQQKEWGGGGVKVTDSFTPVLSLRHCRDHWDSRQVKCSQRYGLAQLAYESVVTSASGVCAQPQMQMI